MADNVTELRREIRKEGFDTRKDNKGHWNVFNGDGDIVRNSNGIPLSFSDTPSHPNWLNKATAELRRAEVLPRPSRQVGGKRFKADDPRTEELRESIKLIIEAYGIRQSQIIEYADTYHAQRKLPVPASPQNQLSRFLKGSGISSVGYKFFKAAADSIISLDGKLPIAEPIPTFVPTPAPQPEEAKTVEKPVPIKPTDVVVEDVKIPTLAFETMRLLYREDRDEDAIRDLVERIARLELGE